MNLINSIFTLMFLVSKHLNKFSINFEKIVISLKNEGSDKLIFSIVINNPERINWSFGISLSFESLLKNSEDILS